ncbi:arginine--tRNA ligase [Candidatus Uhrbacteria bacterium RIFCSPHIGHO2_12_FULL_60_25]|uniref:arginine--tRNA ligase n=1 Tax=Candidatus Uhrbacteria bacterium RIFCSPHIGHO2_12_FULL_60_25 TaxID=1802399 RepID=A0A1F7UPK7_9BACT|nr:MAG: arginine--tRNA ligase [Candidatus Uhrbacteria bacterium RIFCSPHIGHO2_02_FULL_60_44]OGL79638.1 MAG: arginine--tRNA ligase [Candidatus Uhrbacteria bacterium RIFCSPHIGHO2_12_FULL_60_25]
MPSFWLHVKSHVAQRLTSASGVKVTPDDLVAPPRPELGDLAFGCFKVAKTLGKNPAEAAKDVVAKFGSADHLVASASADGPFVNVTLNTGEFIHRVIRDVEAAGAAYGSTDAGKGKALMLEYAQPNTHKEMHVGHLRNLVLGASLVKILSHAGWKVIPASYHGDVGAHVAKCLWWFVEKSRDNGVGTTSPESETKKSKKKIVDEKRSAAMGLSEKEVDAFLAAVPREKKTGKYLGEIYTQASREVETHEENKHTVSAVQKALESHDPIWNKLWLETRRWSLDEFTELFDELGIKIERQYLESEVVDEGQKIVDQLLTKGVAKVSEGAVIVDLEGKKLGMFLIRKSDGTSLYATKDLALAYLKQREYPKLGRSVLLVDGRQSLYFKQLFETLKLMGYTVPTEHVGYEFVTLKSGAMSSREGNIVTYQSFRDEVLKKTREETVKRHADWNDGKVTYTSWAVALAGMKFGMLRQDADKVFMFDLDAALSFEGQTGPYVQYTIVRLTSILKKAGNPSLGGGDTPDCRILKEPTEKALVLSLARFNDVFQRSADDMRPNRIAEWCIETSQLANAFYRDVKVIGASDAERDARLRLVSAAKDALTVGLDLLGIPVPEEM